MPFCIVAIISVIIITIIVVVVVVVVIINNNQLVEFNHISIFFYTNWVQLVRPRARVTVPRHPPDP